MRRVLLLLAAIALPAGPLAAQPATPRGGEPGRQGPAAERTGGEPQRSPGAPIDRGAATPEANAAHRGGGAVLEGAPGAPAPAPMPTPPLPASPPPAPAR